MENLLSVYAITLASFSAGFLTAYLVQLRGLRADMVAKVENFHEVTKAASAANHSMADKLLQIDARIDSIESWRSIMGATTNQHSAWKK